ncbi:DUF4623 domain-containing protein [candidate division KSB1 bacterium]|nr:DUF4623 domain-containing protein [candidate division KSB1 bacterium]
MNRKTLLFFALLWAVSASAQYPVNWIDYDLINPGNDLTRSLAYNKTTDHVLVASRLNGTRVQILDAANGDSLGTLDTAIIAGGTYPVNMVAVANDGTIYVGNLTAPQYTPGSMLKIYRYNDENASPELVFEDALDGGRYGDALAAIGSGADKWIYVGGMDNPKMAVLRDRQGATLDTEALVSLPVPGNARHGISPTAPGGPVWINAAGPAFPPTLIAADGTLIASVPDTLISPGGSSGVVHTKLGAFNLLTVVNAYSATIRSVRYLSDELGTVTFDYFGSDSDSSALFYKGAYSTNINATGGVVYDNRRNAFIALVGVNSIASLSLEQLLKTSTPRDSLLTISIDGDNDFFPTDLIGETDSHRCYTTWSEGKFFIGITGPTLIDPNENNFLYVAFDLDPQGEAGSTQPPRTDGGVSTLPFRADVVYMVEPYPESDYMIGSIFKWNGSAWQESEFDGNFASQGALAFAAEGVDKIAELCAVRNAPGLGEEIGALSFVAYVADRTIDGDLVCTFPIENHEWNGSFLNYSYHIEELGENLFPTDPAVVQTIKSEYETGIETLKDIIAASYELQQNYPNPFNPETTIRYTLPHSCRVQLKIYDVSGRLVKTLVNEPQPAGSHEIVFDGRHIGSGILMYRLTIDDRHESIKKMILLK